MLRRVGILAACAAIGVAGLILAPARGPQSTARVLETLAALDGSALQGFVTAHPRQVLELANSDPVRLRDDWDALAASEQRRLERVVPALVGNGDGLPYALRDRANRRQLATELAAAQQDVRSHPDDRSAVARASAYLAIHKALRPLSGIHRSLVEFVPAVQPTAAIAVGDPDTARIVTWAVPGMGTYTTDMQLWTLAAQNIWHAQGDAGAPRDRAVIAWMGYATPPVGLDAALGDYAANGAPLLIEAIRGMTAARDASVPALNVVAHSYGTTMAADALADADLGVSNVVMLGSAGVEERIPTAADLHAAAVYAIEASADTEARLGRTSRLDPRAPAFGARVLPSDGDPAAGLLPVTGHAPILHSPWNDDPASTAWRTITPPEVRDTLYRDHMSTHGYLDVGTQSLAEVGVASSGIRTPPARADRTEQEPGTSRGAIPLPVPTSLFSLER